MKIYDIEIIGYGEMPSERNHYIMAENFDEAITQAHKLLAHIRKKYCEDAYIKSICEQFKLEVVKEVKP
jgi:hypothetical protein